MAWINVQLGTNILLEWVWVKRLAVFELADGARFAASKLLDDPEHLFKPTEPTCTGRRDSLRMVNTQKQNKTRQWVQRVEKYRGNAEQTGRGCGSFFLSSSTNSHSFTREINPLHNHQNDRNFSALRFLLFMSFVSSLFAITIMPTEIPSELPKSSGEDGRIDILFLLMGWISRF